MNNARYSIPTLPDINLVLEKYSQDFNPPPPHPTTHFRRGGKMLNILYTLDNKVMMTRDEFLHSNVSVILLVLTITVITNLKTLLQI